MYEIKVFDIGRLNDVLLFEESLQRQEPKTYYWTIDDEYISSVKNSFINDKFKDSLSLLAYEGGSVVGRIDTTLIASHFDGSLKAYLDWICVLKSHRHKGVAQMLMSAARCELKKIGAEAIIGIIANNEEAMRFYRKLPDASIKDEGIWITI